MRAVVAVACVLGVSGCLIGGIVSTKHEVLNESKIETRVSSHVADVSGEQCFVDEKVRTMKMAHVDSWWGTGGAFDALLFGIAGGGTTGDDQTITLAIAADGALAFAYFVLMNRHTSTSEDWHQTRDTAACLHPRKPRVDIAVAAPIVAPPVVTDSDGDGIRDTIDKCPNAPEDKDGYQDDDGCPDPDNDGDGIPDNVDKCPNVPEDKDGFQDQDGCPDPDNDGDGIPDTADKCPNQPEDKDGFQDQDGCPDPDNDGDGVLDAQDKCPDQLETKNGYQDDDGCPDEIPPKLAAVLGPLRAEFKKDGTALLPKSNAGLDAVAAALKAVKDAAVEIDVYTGPHADAQALSQARAQAIKASLMLRGVDESQMVAVGSGEGTAAAVELKLTHKK